MKGVSNGKRLTRLAVMAAAVLVCAFTLLGIFIHGRKEAAEPKRIIFIPKIIDEDNDFWVQLLEGARMAAQEYGMEIEIVAASEETAFEEQNELILWAVEQKPDAIVLAPSSQTATVETVEDVKKSGIPLILVDSDVDNDEGLTMVATDNVAAGRIQGEFMRSFLKEDDQIALICHVKGSSTALDREKGFREGLSDYAENIVEVVYCDSDYEKAYELMDSILDRYPKLCAVAGLNEYSAVGAARAIIDRGYEGKIKMVGFDSSLEEIRLLERGVFQGIVIQNPYKMGYLAVEAVQRILSGEEQGEHIDSGAKLVTRDQVFTEENQKVLFLFTED